MYPNEQKKRKTKLLSFWHGNKYRKITYEWKAKMILKISYANIRFLHVYVSNICKRVYKTSFILSYYSYRYNSYLYLIGSSAYAWSIEYISSKQILLSFYYKILCNTNIKIIIITALWVLRVGKKLLQFLRC